MAITFTYDEESSRFLTRVIGHISPLDPVAHLEEVLAHPQGGPGLVAFVTCEQVALEHLTGESVVRLLRFMRQFRAQIHGARVAVVAEQAVVYGLLLMLEFKRDPLFDFKVFFRDSQAALLWLDASDAG